MESLADVPLDVRHAAALTVLHGNSRTAAAHLNVDDRWELLSCVCYGTATETPTTVVRDPAPTQPPARPTAPPGTCAVCWRLTGEARKAYTRRSGGGLCQGHYNRLKRGQPVEVVIRKYTYRSG